MDLEPGAQFGNYVVESTIGRGGMATVFRTRHTRLDSLHALKVLHVPSPVVRERLIQEGRAQARLRHRNVLPVTDVVDVEGSPGLVMDYVEGPSLASLLAARHPTLEQADQIARGIIAGVRAAHRRGLVHRDLKPQNVLLARTDEGLTPMVADFGLAKVFEGPPGEGMTVSGTFLGTPGFMAPEQFRDASAVDERADVFSLGVILYLLATGARPFAGKDLMELYTQCASETYLPPRERKPGLPRRMETAIVWSLRADPAARIPDCEVLLDVWNGERGFPEVDGPPGPWDRSILEVHGELARPSEGVDGSAVTLDATVPGSTDPGASTLDGYVTPAPEASTLGDSTLDAATLDAATLDASTLDASTLDPTASGLHELSASTIGQESADPRPPPAPSTASNRGRPVVLLLAGILVVAGSLAVSWRLGLWSEWIDPGDDSPGSAGAVATGEERVNHESVHDAEGVAVGLEPGAAEPVGEDARADPDAQEAPPSSAAEPPAEPPGSIERAGPTDSTVEHHPPAAGTDAEPIELGTLLVNARPPSTLSIDGVDMGSTHWVGELPPGPHRVELVTGDGRRVTRTVNVYAAYTAKLCWDFGLGAECPK